MEFDVLIKGGTVVNSAGSQVADVAIVGEKIAAVGHNLGAFAKAKKVIDAKGHYVIPGVLDVHVHLELPFCGTTSSDDYRTGTRAGARGGVTTVIDFAIPYRKADGDGEYDTLSEAVDNWHRKAEGKSLIDYTFHCCVTNYDQHQKEIAGMVKRGFTTFKEFMIYASEGWQADDRAMYGTLELMEKHGSMLLVHAESSRVLDEFIARYHNPKDMKKYKAQLHAMSRPNIVEWEAIQRAGAWCEATGGQLYIVHMSTGEGADIVARLQDRGVPIVAETCAQYLVLDDSVFARKDGHLYACCPQLKKPWDCERLWDGINGGEVSVVSTDTCTFTKKQKAMWNGDWTKIPMGMPGLETLMPVTYTKGVLEDRISIERMVEVLCVAPAQIMGLSDRKGDIRPGLDADLVIFHPKNKMKVEPKKMETNADWSPFEGWDLAGFARTTLSRGEVIVDNYKVVGKEGRGRWLPRTRAGLFT